MVTALLALSAHAEPLEWSFPMSTGHVASMRTSADASLSDPGGLFLDKVHFNAAGADRAGQEAAAVLRPLLNLPTSPQPMR